MITGTAAISVANPNRDGTGAIVTLVAGPGRVDIIRANAPGAITAGNLRFFVRNGTNPWTLWREVAVPTSALWSGADIYPVCAPSALPSTLKLASGFELGVATQNAELFHVQAFGE